MNRRLALLLALAGALLFAGCATTRGPLLVPGVTAGSAGGFPERWGDAFQSVQEASGLAPEFRHPAGVALEPRQARHLLERLARLPATRNHFGPRRVLSWLLREVLAGGGPVAYADLAWRAERFGFLVLVRPDGYLVAALSGAPLQRLGPLQRLDGVWRVGQLGVGDFYFSRSGVFYPVDAALRRVDGPPLGELSLGRDPLNAALDGTQDALREMTVGLAQLLRQPIRTVEGLVQLPTTVALLIASSPEYFARYGGMSLEDQTREAARLSTHVLLLLGSAEATVGRMGGLGAELSLTATGELLWAPAVVAEAPTLGTRLGAFSVLHMAGSGQGPPGSGPKAGSSTPGAAAKGPGRWTYKTPTTESKQALDYQEQVTGRPAWWVYTVSEVEFDGFNGQALLEAKGASYTHFLTKDGALQPWFESGEGYRGLLNQAGRQSTTARVLALPVVWHVAEAKFANILRAVFKENGWDNILVRHTPPTQ